MSASEQQRVLGYTAERDLNQYNASISHRQDMLGPLYEAGVVYLTAPEKRRTRFRDAPEGWPWMAKFWKPEPNDRILELTKAGALFMAELTRLSLGLANQAALDTYLNTSSPILVTAILEAANEIDRLLELPVQGYQVTNWQPGEQHHGIGISWRVNMPQPAPSPRVSKSDLLPPLSSI